MPFTALDATAARDPGSLKHQLYFFIFFFEVGDGVWRPPTSQLVRQAGGLHLALVAEQPLILGCFSKLLGFILLFGFLRFVTIFSRGEYIYLGSEE